METYSVQILNPKAVHLLEDMANSKMISLQPQTPLAREKPLTQEQKAAMYERIMQGGSQTLDVDAMIAYNKQDRPMPFRDSE